MILLWHHTWQAKLLFLMVNLVYHVQLPHQKMFFDGFNEFLKQLDVTFRRDPTNYRPRINKHDSVKDKEQKLIGKFLFNINLDQI